MMQTKLEAKAEWERLFPNAAKDLQSKPTDVVGQTKRLEALRHLLGWIAHGQHKGMVER